ncbi:AI-2E family transporter [Peribacillus deserti]|uniref:AI-2E family transporter n=1 Tax=Peribacillus deserti TaxID=673318 RepID=A0A2N5M2M9_9BACI|nr:AI-2E family transporter [Peribacillus deserti]PLT28626.1 AI-2E family transporter [Peribacillus deserti]
MPNTKYFRLGYGIIILLIIIYLGTKVDFIFRPIKVLFQTLFFPFLISGVIYYLLRPIVHFLQKRKVPKGLSILIIYLLFIGLGTVLMLWVGPELQKQFKSFIDNFPGLLDTLKQKVVGLRDTKWFSRFQENDYVTLDTVTSKLNAYINTNVSNLGNKITGILGIITNVATIVVTVPFIVFYLLKDGDSAPNGVLRFLPRLQAKEGKKILKDMDSALSSYIQGQAIVSFIVGVMMYIGYLIIGIDYSLILAIIAMLTNVIPFVGPFIAIIPALIIGFIASPFMALKVVIVAVVVQQIDGNLSSPYIMGRKLDIHPLTIILLLLVAGSMAGLLGMILAVPFYAVLKVIVSHTYRLYRLHKDKESVIDL